MLEPILIPDCEHHNTIGYYVVGHKDPEDFVKSVQSEYGVEIDKQKVEHTFFVKFLTQNLDYFYTNPSVVKVLFL